MTAAVLWMLAGAHGASAAAITLGSASTYGVLLGTSDTLKFGGGFNITGDVGLGSSDTLTKAGTNAITGVEYKDSGLSTSGSGTVTVSGGVVTQSMTQAIANATSASTTAGALTGTAGLNGQGGSISLNGTSMVIKALDNLSENVLNISSLSLTNGTLTFDDNGYTGAKFIVNVTGGFTINSSGALKSIIQGINGASAADIIFNIEGSGSTVSITGNSTNQIIGTILAPSRNVTVGGGGSLTGALIAGVKNVSGSTTLQSNSGGYNITSFGYKPPTGGTKTPEPSTFALFGAGIAALAAVRYRRKFLR